MHPNPNPDTISDPRPLEIPANRQDAPHKSVVVLLLVLFALLATNLVSAKTTTVGSCPAINNAISLAEAGDTIVVRNDVYTNCKINFDPPQHGQENSPITLMAESVGGVTFTGENSQLTLKKNYLVVKGFKFHKITTPQAITFIGSKHSVFEHNRLFEVSYTRSTCPAQGGLGALSIGGGSTHNLITRNDFIDFPCAGVKVRGASNNENNNNIFSYNYFRDGIANAVEGSGEGEHIQIGQGNQLHRADNTQITQNLWEDTVGQSEIISIKVPNVVISGNTFRKMKDSVVIRFGFDSKFTDNYMLDTKGVVLNGKRHIVSNNYFEGGPLTGRGQIETRSRPEVQVVDPQITRNTVVGAASNHIWFGTFSTNQRGAETLNAIVRDNIVVASKGWVYRDGGSSNARIQGNIVWTQNTGTLGDMPNSGNTLADPQLVRQSGVLVSSRYPGKGFSIKCRPLQRNDVGVGSTYACNLGNTEPSELNYVPTVLGVRVTRETLSN